MNRILRKHHFYVAGALLVVPVIALWSWNTLSDLFNLPLAQYRHILALLFLALLLKWLLTPVRMRRPSRHGDHHAQQTP